MALSYEFELHLSSTQYLDYYRGIARQVIARCADGRSIQFPASLLQKFLTPEGIHGDFILTCDDDHRHARLERRA